MVRGWREGTGSAGQRRGHWSWAWRGWLCRRWGGKGMPRGGHNLEAESQVHLRAVDSQLCLDYLCRFISRALVSVSVWRGSGRPVRGVAGGVECRGERVPEGQVLLLLAFRQLWVDVSPIFRAFVA